MKVIIQETTEVQSCGFIYSDALKLQREERSNMIMTAFCSIAPCSLEAERSFGDAYCLQNQGNDAHLKRRSISKLHSAIPKML
jgi:hypothetical protein